MGINGFPIQTGFNPSSYNNRGVVDYNASAGDVTLLEVTSGGGFIEHAYLGLTGGVNAEVKITVDGNILWWGESGAGALSLYVFDYNNSTSSDGSPNGYVPDLDGRVSIPHANQTIAEDLTDGSVVSNDNQMLKPFYFKNTVKIEFIRPTVTAGTAKIVYKTR